MRLLICAGGTGGGVYPALAVLQSLKNNSEAASQLSLLWIGSEGGMENDLVKRVGVPYDTIPAAGVHGVGLKALPGNILRLVRGYYRAQSLIAQFDPQVMFFTGGYLAVPVALAGRSIPSLVYVPDIEPGLALKVLAHYASLIAVTVKQSMDYFRKQSRIKVVGYPTRPELKTWTREAALETFGLRSDLPVLLVSGGSSGARSINRALMPALPDLLEEMQVIHITGKLDWDEIIQIKVELEERNEQNKILFTRYKPFSYLHEEMGAALSAANLIVTRAGASVLGELPAFGLPAILVPYPYAWRYQQINAEYLRAQGAAVIISDQDLTSRLTEQVRKIISDQAALQDMKQAMRAQAHPEAANEIADMLVRLAEGESLKRINP